MEFLQVSLAKGEIAHDRISKQNEITQNRQSNSRQRTLDSYFDPHLTKSSLKISFIGGTTEQSN